MSSLALALQTVPGLPHLIAMRPFTVAFLLAVQVYNQYMGAGIAALPVIAYPPVLMVLAVLALAEWFAELNIDTRALQRSYSQYVSPLVALLLTAGYLDAETNRVLQTTVAAGSGGVLGMLVQVGASIVMAVGVWVVAGLRNAVLNAIAELDEEDDLGLQGLVSWSENLLVVIGVLIFVILPTLSLVLAGLTVLGLFGIERYLAYREQRSKVPCSRCQAPMLLSAVSCHICGQPNPAPRAVGLFGQPTRTLASDIGSHRLHLTSRKRCHVCASRLPQRSLHQACPTCGTWTFADPAHLQTYLASLRRQLPRTLLICLGLSALPLVGLVPGIIYYRLTLINSLAGYIPRSTGCLTRWGVRLWNILLIGFQWVPLFGALVLPLMALSNFLIYQSVVLQASRQIPARPAQVPAAAPPAGVSGAPPRA